MKQLWEVVKAEYVLFVLRSPCGNFCAAGAIVSLYPADYFLTATTAFSLYNLKTSINTSILGYISSAEIRTNTNVGMIQGNQWPNGWLLLSCKQAYTDLFDVVWGEKKAQIWCNAMESYVWELQFPHCITPAASHIPAMLKRGWASLKSPPEEHNRCVNVVCLRINHPLSFITQSVWSVWR